MEQYNLVVCGGTFDHFHKGHEAFLRFVLSRGRKVALGITSDAYVQKKELHEVMESYEKRKAAVTSFLQTIKSVHRVEIAQIDSLYIPDSWEKAPIGAIIVSKDTRWGAEAINAKRKEKHLTAIPIEEQPLVAGSDGKFISSFRIRNGEINREGRSYIKPRWLTQTLVLPKTLRQELKKPIGEVITNFTESKFAQSITSTLLVTVGDVVTKSCIDQKINPSLAIVDFVIKRKKTFSHLSELGFHGDEKVFFVKNPPGYITPGLFTTVKNVFLQNMHSTLQIIQIDGEEDLSVLPVMMTAPLGTVILYGQPGIGVVSINLTEANKEKAYSILEAFHDVGMSSVLEVIDKK